MGFIYKLTSPSGKIYIGQTIKSVQHRWKSHIEDAHRVYKDHCKVLNKAIRKHGHKHFLVETLEECEDKELDSKEIEYILRFNSQVPYGMNIKLGGSNGKHHELTKIQISNSLKGRIVSIETKQKLSITTNPNLPMYLIKHSKGYRVVNHPMGPEKKFICSKGDTYNLQRALKYLDKLNNLSEPIVVQKRTLPMYLQVHRNGYCVRYPGHKHKYFVSRTISNEELLKNALEFLERLKSTSDVQRLNGSGESLQIP